MKLIIVESPSKAKTIQKYLGRGYKVVASGGHIRDLPDKRLGINIDNDFEPQYVVSGKNKDKVKKIRESVKLSEQVYLATDPDREGEAISWHLAQILKLDDAHRIVFNEISKKSVKNAIDNPRKINHNLVNAQQARRVLDRIVGYKVSPVLARKIKRGISGGRVQSVALKMIVDREKEIKAFTPEEYWNLFALLSKKDKKTSPFKASFNDINGKKIKLTTGAQVKDIEEDLKTADFEVDKIKKSITTTKPYAPFITSTLQQDGSIKLNMSAPKVMQLAQQLYEGINIEGLGQTALVTYIRTDSVRISEDFQTETLDFIREKYGEDYAPRKANIYKTKSTNTQDAHEAIRPIALDITPQSIKDKVSAPLYNLYKIIYNRYLASQMTNAKYNSLSVDIVAKATKNNYGFKVTGRTLKFDGYTILYNNDTNEEAGATDLPDFSEGESFIKKEIQSEQKFTKPPSRYTDASLVKAMEENGIGRPSTYASVISTLIKREYTIKEKSSIVPTELGETVSEFMEHYFNDIVDVHFTANVENKLDEIENGIRWQDIIADFYPPFMEKIDTAYKEAERNVIAPVASDIICKKCNSPMYIRESRFGKFLGCSNYPECDHKESIVEKIATCPDCSGDVIKRKSKKGRTFYGCANYPDCNFISWDIPAPYRCPACKSIMKVTVKDGKTLYKCLNTECNNSILVKGN